MSSQEKTTDPEGGATKDGSVPPDQDDIIYPSGLKVALLMTSIFIAMFLVSLDRMIISTAIPQITDEFDSAGDIGWYGTAYLLTSCAFQLLFGKLYTVFSIKATFLISILLFEIGSALCGAAPNSLAFILGRAIAGLGSGGIMSGNMVIMVYALPLQKRPKYQGLFGVVLALSSVSGPLIGGAFTTNVTWRWCFYLNLPLGALVLLFVFLILHVPDRPSTRIPLKDKLKQLNALGVLAIVPATVCLCLALQWGGTLYAWSNGRIVALLVLAFVFFIAFVLIQIWKPEQAMLPPRMLAQRSIASGCLTSVCIYAHTMIFVYYLPIWFQAIDGASAVDSGLHLLPTVVSLVIATISTGLLVSRIGYYTPFLIFGVCITSIGAGLLTTLDLDTTRAKWIGFQILYGFGLGASVQAPNMAVQTVLPREQVAIGASFMFFGQQLSGAIFASVGQNVLDNQLASRLSRYPGVSPDLIQSTGATELLGLIPPEYHQMALQDYNESLRVCFKVGLIMACISILGALGMEWRSVKKNKPSGNVGDSVAKQEDNLKRGLEDVPNSEST